MFLHHYRAALAVALTTLFVSKASAEECRLKNSEIQSLVASQVKLPIQSWDKNLIASLTAGNKVFLLEQIKRQERNLIAVGRRFFESRKDDYKANAAMEWGKHAGVVPDMFRETFLKLARREISPDMAIILSTRDVTNYLARAVSELHSLEAKPAPCPKVMAFE